MHTTVEFSKRQGESLLKLGMSVSSNHFQGGGGVHIKKKSYNLYN